MINMSPSHPLYPWITHPTSLTEKLASISVHIRLEVLQHAWDMPQTTSAVLTRKIVTWAQFERCWFARTMIPLRTYSVEAALFSRLTTQALGELIWPHPHIKRAKLHYYPINPHHPEYALLDDNMHHNQPILWARHSTFLVHKQHPFYLLEIFLPGLERISA